MHTSSSLIEQQKKSRKARNLAIGLMVGMLVIIFYTITLLRIG